MRLQVYLVTIHRGVTGVSRQRSVAAERPEDIDRLVQLTRDEVITSRKPADPLKTWLVNWQAKGVTPPKGRESFYGLLKTYFLARPDLTYALEKAVRQVQSPGLANAVLRVLDRLPSASFQALHALDGPLPETDVEALVAGCLGSNTLMIIESLYGKAQRDVNAGGKIKKAVAYPLFLFGLASGLVIYTATTTLPQMVKSFSLFGATPTGPTAFVFALGDILGRYPEVGLIPFVGVLVALWQHKAIFHTAPVQRLLSRSTQIRRLMFMLGMSDSLEIYGILHRAQVGPFQELTMTSKASKVPAVREFFLRVRDSMHRGSQSFFEAALPHTPLLGEEGYQFVSLMEAGDTAGANDTIATTMAAIYRRETDEALDLLGQFIAPIVFIMAGLMIAFLAMIVIIPDIQLDTQILPNSGVVSHTSSVPRPPGH